MKQIITILLVLQSLCTFAANPDFAWAKEFGQNGLSTSSSVFLDEAGNTYIAGNYTSALTLGSITLPLTANSNQFIAKIDPDGTILWAKRMEGLMIYDDMNQDKMIVDADGNIYLTGVAYATAKVESTVLSPLSGTNDYCLLKFDASGNLLWCRMADGAENLSRGFSAVMVDSKNNICMTGLFSTSISFGTHTLTNPTGTGVDGFIVRYNAAGDVVKATELGVVNGTSTSLNFQENEIFRLDGNDNLYRLSIYKATLTKYNVDGTVLLSKVFSTSGAIVQFSCMGVYKTGEIVVGGWFYNGSLTVEGTLIPKYGQSIRTDAFMIKMDASGTKEWVKAYQYSVSDAYTCIRIDDIGNIYAIGQHADVSTIRSLLIKYSPAGTVLWEQVIDPGPTPPGGSNGWAEAKDMAQTNNGGNIVVVGRFKERLYFNAATNFVTPVGDAKIFLAQYGVCTTPAIYVTTTANSFCSGDSTLLTASPAGMYQWSTGETAVAIYVHNTNNYFAVVAADDECYSRSPVVHVTAHTLPVAQIEQEGSILKATEENASYQWLSADANYAPIAGATDRFYQPEDGGEFAVIVTNSNGCSDTSASHHYLTTGLPGKKEMLTISLFPNPASTMLQMQGLESVTEVIIMNATGQKIMEANQTTINVDALQEGLYYIMVETVQGSWQGKFVKR